MADDAHRHAAARRLAAGALLAAAILLAALGDAAPLRAAEPAVVLSGIPWRYEIPPERGLSPDDTIAVTLDGVLVYRGPARAAAGGVPITARGAGRREIALSAAAGTSAEPIRVIPAWFSLLPPLLAIAIALVFKQVVVALLAGVWLGNLFLDGYRPLQALLRIVDHDVIGALSAPGQGADRVSIVVFTLLLGGMVGIMYQMAGMQGIVDRVGRIATTPRRSQFAAWLMGTIVFFDDYMNSLIVGNSMRPLTDRVRVSREKLSYIIDSTSAPDTAIAIVTSWVGFQISLIGQAFVSLGVDRNPFTAYVAAIPYSYYPICATLMVLFVALMNRDFSAMLAAERRARSTGKVMRDGAVLLSNIDAENVSAPPGTAARWINGVVPIVVVIGTAFAGLVVTGRAALAAAGETGGLVDAMRNANSFTALLWCSMAGCLAAGLLALVQRLASLTDILAAWLNGIRAMMLAIVILVLAWCIGMVCTELHTADYLVHALSGVLSPHALPMLVFLVAMGISFSTGTSWGTMSILTPIVVPLAFGTARAAGIEGPAFDTILYSSIGAILSGAVFGDHCSPISDTTIMSSMASACDHIDHVRTQLPYALVVAAVSFVFGYLPVAAGLPTVWALLLCVGSLPAILRLAGRSPDAGGVG